MTEIDFPVPVGPTNKQCIEYLLNYTRLLPLKWHNKTVQAKMEISMLVAKMLSMPISKLSMKIESRLCL